MAFFNGKIHYKWPCSIAMLNYQRVSPLESKHHHEKSPPSFRMGFFSTPKHQHAEIDMAGKSPHIFGHLLDLKSSNCQGQDLCAMGIFFIPRGRDAIIITMFDGANTMAICCRSSLPQCYSHAGLSGKKTWCITVSLVTSHSILVALFCGADRIAHSKVIAANQLHCGVPRCSECEGVDRRVQQTEWRFPWLQPPSYNNCGRLKQEEIDIRWYLAWSQKINSCDQRCWIKIAERQGEKVWFSLMAPIKWSNCWRWGCRSSCWLLVSSPKHDES